MRPQLILRSSSSPLHAATPKNVRSLASGRIRQLGDKTNTGTRGHGDANPISDSPRLRVSPSPRHPNGLP
jgi:hypothetical protein